MCAFVAGCGNGTTISGATLEVSKVTDVVVPPDTNKHSFEIEIIPQDAKDIVGKKQSLLVPTQMDLGGNPNYFRGQSDLANCVLDVKSEIKDEGDNVVIEAGDGHRIVVPKGNIVKAKITGESSKNGMHQNTTNTGKSKGSDIDTDNTENIKNVKTGASEFNLDDGSGSNAGFNLAGQITSNPGMAALIVLGGLALITGCIAVAYGQRKLGISLVIGGGALVGLTVVAQKYPWVYLLCILMVIGYGVYTVYMLYQNNKQGKQLAVTSDTLEATVEGIENSDPAHAAHVKENIKEATKSGYTTPPSVMKNLVTDLKTGLAPYLK
jgi:hypothetical protein